MLASGFDETLTRTLVTAAKDGGLDLFAGAGHVSAKAARNIIPALMQGLTYDKACARAGVSTSPCAVCRIPALAPVSGQTP